MQVAIPGFIPKRRAKVAVTHLKHRERLMAIIENVGTVQYMVPRKELLRHLPPYSRVVPEGYDNFYLNAIRKSTAHSMGKKILLAIVGLSAILSFILYQLNPIMGSFIMAAFLGIVIGVPLGAWVGYIQAPAPFWIASLKKRGKEWYWEPYRFDPLWLTLWERILAKEEKEARRDNFEYIRKMPSYTAGGIYNMLAIPWVKVMFRFHKPGWTNLQFAGFLIVIGVLAFILFILVGEMMKQ